MLRHRIPLGIAFLAAFPCGAIAQSQQYSQPQIENSKLAKEKSPAQPSPTVNFPTSQEITEAVANGIERADEKRETQHPAPPPVYSGWWFNFFLVGFTGLLAVIGAGQCYLIFRTLKATEIAADAAKGALIATARPKIIVRKVEAVFQMPPNRSVTVQFKITNVGGSRTVLIERNAILDTSYRQRGHPFPKYVGSSVSNEHGLESGEPLHAAANFADPRMDPSEENIRAGTSPLFLFGYVRYRDEVGIVREKGFGRQFNSKTNRFDPLNDPEVEYGD
jgi:hypothetical protein